MRFFNKYFPLWHCPDHVLHSYFENDQIDNTNNRFVFGGSTIENDGSPTKEVSLVEYLNIMNENLHDNTIVKVHNEGVSGYFSKQLKDFT